MVFLLRFSNDDAIYGEIKTDHEASVGVILTIITPFFLFFFFEFSPPEKFNLFRSYSLHGFAHRNL